MVGSASWVVMLVAPDLGSKDLWLHQVSGSSAFSMDFSDCFLLPQTALTITTWWCCENERQNNSYWPQMSASCTFFMHAHVCTPPPSSSLSGWIISPEVIIVSPSHCRRSAQGGGGYITCQRFYSNVEATMKSTFNSNLFPPLHNE